MEFANPKRPTLTELQVLMDRSGGSLDLRGTAITALPEDLTVGGSLYLGGVSIPVLYEDGRGYQLRRIWVGREGEWFAAGCRLFRSRADALAHWGSDSYPVMGRGAMFCAAIRACPEGWPNEQPEAA